MSVQSPQASIVWYDIQILRTENLLESPTVQGLGQDQGRLLTLRPDLHLPREPMRVNARPGMADLCLTSSFICVTTNYYQLSPVMGNGTEWSALSWHRVCLILRVAMSPSRILRISQGFLRVLHCLYIYLAWGPDLASAGSKMQIHA